MTCTELPVSLGMEAEQQLAAAWSQLRSRMGYAVLRFSKQMWGSWHEHCAAVGKQALQDTFGHRELPKPFSAACSACVLHF